MNIYKTLRERQQITKELIDYEMDLLQNKGYNPITESYRLPIEQEGEIFPHTLLIDALKKAKEKVILNKNTAKELRLVLNHVESAAKTLRKDRLRISDVEIKDILIILEEVGKHSRSWSSHNFNKHRAYLMILFKELMQYGAVKYNPAAGIAKHKMIKKIRKVLTDEERVIVKEHLKECYPSFYRFMQIFYHSGSRETEILSVQGKHVDLKSQTFTCTIKKGTEYREVAKVIKDIALPFWIEAVAECSPEQYIFGRKFKPGKKPLSTNKINKTWHEYVKKALGIQADIYSLKHSNSTEIAAILSDEHAAKLNSHQSTGMIIKIYDVHRKSRQDEELKKVNNPF
jgi:integrase